MAKRVRKAVFPVAGLGTRFLPVTKAMPKEMLPVVDKPLIQYAFEEATAAGIEECYFVTGRAKNAIEDHFDTAAELEMTLRERGKDDLLNELDAIVPTPGRIAYTRQQRPLGLGHAVWCARHLVGDEPLDRKSTRLNSSHVEISYAVFCLKKKKKKIIEIRKKKKKKNKKIKKEKTNKN